MREPRNEREARAALGHTAGMPRKARQMLHLRQAGESCFGRLAWAGVIVFALAVIAADMLMWRPG
jgi:hypothetical protein